MDDEEYKRRSDMENLYVDDRVKGYNLIGHSRYNGTFATLKSFNPTQKRWTVQFDLDNKVLYLKE